MTDVPTNGERESLSFDERSKLELYPFNLVEILVDSPVFRKKLLESEENLGSLITQIKILIKLYRTLKSVTTNYNEVINQVFNEIDSISKNRMILCDVDVEFFQTTMHSFLKYLSELEAKKMEIEKCANFESLLDEQKRIKNSVKKWLRLCSQIDSMAFKISSLKKNSTKLHGLEIKYSGLKNLQLTSALKTVSKINNFMSQCRLNFLKSTRLFVKFNNRYMKEANKLFLKNKKIFIKNNIEIVNEEKKMVVRRNRNKTRISESMLKMHANKNTSEVVQGYLFCRNGASSNKRNYFILKSGILSCYKNMETDSPKYVFDLALCSVKLLSNFGKNYCFEFISPYKSFVLQAESQESMNKWFSSIQTSIENRIINARPLDLNYMTDSSDKTSKNVDGNELLEALYTIDECNTTCADCNYPNPTWASINIGILICLECSGIHRSMGTHLSKVRSLVLDIVDIHSFMLIKTIGNKNSNAIFEANIDSYEKINPNSLRKDREEWIKRKYSSKSMIKKYDGTDLSGDFLESIHNGDLLQVVQLYAQGADINKAYEEKDNKKPIHYAADGNPLVLEYLIQNGADINAKDDFGSTPLHYAVVDKVNNACILCKHRAIVNITNSNNETPESIALKHQNPDSLSLLRLLKLFMDEEGQSIYKNEKDFMEILSNFGYAFDDFDSSFYH